MTLTISFLQPATFPKMAEMDRKALVNRTPKICRQDTRRIVDTTPK